MKGRIIIVVALLFIFTSSIYAQKDSTTTKIVFAELFGRCDMYSFNFEYVFKQHHSASVGFSTFPGTWQLSGENDRTFYQVPLTYNYILGKTDHKIDFSAGVLTTITWYYEFPNNYKFTPQIGAGYRYHRKAKGLFIHAGVVVNIPLFLSADRFETFFYTGSHWLLWPSVAAGWSF